VRYSVDGGQSWQVLGRDLTATSLTIDATRLPGSNAARVQVMVADGLDVATAEVSGLTIPRKAPIPTIHDPGAGSALPLGYAVLVRGEAEDLEEIDEAGYVWTSDRAGALGTGRRLWVSTLMEGAHRLTLTVTNRQGLSASATRDVTVSTSRQAWNRKTPWMAL
jgi:hypothetical protein